jgi:hypothetical protein
MHQGTQGNKSNPAPEKSQKASKNSFHIGIIIKKIIKESCTRITRKNL